MLVPGCKDPRLIPGLAPFWPISDDIVSDDSSGIDDLKYGQYFLTFLPFLEALYLSSTQLILINSVTH